MKKFLCLVVLILLFTLFYHCAIQPPPGKIETPQIRVGIVEGENNIQFRAGEDFNIYSHDGAFLGTGAGDNRYEVTVIGGQKAEVRYQLLVKTLFDERTANNVLKDVLTNGLPAKIKKKRQRMVKDGRFGRYTAFQVCLELTFENEIDAQKYRDDIRNIQITTVDPFIQKLPLGIIQLKNLATGKIFESRSYLQIIGNRLVFDVRVGSGYHFEKTETRSYRGHLNFVIDRYGKLTLVNELPMEEYLQGVVASEMHADFPIEAVKAQTVSARGYTLSRLNRQHALDPFDLCDEVHCQVYGGITKASANTITAVNETAGEVLMYQNKICETFYLAVCGGHTEHNENVWQGEPEPYLRGVFDLPLNKVSVEENFLMLENNLQKWMDNYPRVYCNVYLIDLPAYLDYTKKYFRWIVNYTQAELRNIIEKKTGQSVGSIIDIIPVERGISGRLKKIQIKGSDRAITIEKELEIRRTLSENYLYSSCFIVDKAEIINGVPHMFIIKGAGWGHGVGMCQTGAAVMALQGVKYVDILNHYYRDAKIVRLY